MGLQCIKATHEYLEESIPGRFIPSIHVITGENLLINQAGKPAKDRLFGWIKCINLGQGKTSLVSDIKQGQIPPTARRCKAQCRLNDGAAMVDCCVRLCPALGTTRSSRRFFCHFRSPIFGCLKAYPLNKALGRPLPGPGYNYIKAMVAVFDREFAASLGFFERSDLSTGQVDQLIRA